MEKYWLLKDDVTLEAYLSQYMENTPDNGVVFDVDNHSELKKPKFNIYPNPTMVTEGCTPQEVRATKMERTKEKYEVHQRNGWNAYQDFRANIVQEIEEKIINEQMAFIIEDNLKVGYDRIQQTGDWKTALYFLQHLVVSHMFVEPYRIAAIQVAENYISVNYES